MSIEAGLSTFLLQSAGIALYVSNRVYAERLPEPTTADNTSMPCITYSLVSENVEQTYASENWHVARIQIDAWATSYKSAHDTAAAIHTALQGYRGAWNEHTVGGVFRKRKNDMPAADIKLHRVSMDYVINYS